MTEAVQQSAASRADPVGLLFPLTTSPNPIVDAGLSRLVHEDACGESGRSRLVRSPSRQCDAGNCKNERG
jgi:hypothetical protein